MPSGRRSPGPCENDPEQTGHGIEHHPGYSRCTDRLGEPRYLDQHIPLTSCLTSYSCQFALVLVYRHRVEACARAYGAPPRNLQAIANRQELVAHQSPHHFGFGCLCFARLFAGEQRPESVFIVANGLAETLGWGLNRFRRARNRLEETEIEMVRLARPSRSRRARRWPSAPPRNSRWRSDRQASVSFREQGPPSPRGGALA
jgi:hypothetical protein